MRVPAEPFADAFARSGETPSAVAYRLNWLRPNRSRADTSRLRRALAQPHVNTSTALLLAEALGLDPVDVGL